MSYRGTLALQELGRYHGDNAALSIALTDPDTGSSFTATGHTLQFTLKRDPSQADADSLVQKLSSVGGITVANPSVVSLVPDDFESILAERLLHWDLRAQNNSTGAIKTVARGTIIFPHTVAQSFGLSVDTYTTSPSSLLNKVDTFPASPTAAGTINQYAIDDEGSLAICVVTGTEGNALWLKFSGSAEWS
jgi:hypothetical protein